MSVIWEISGEEGKAMDGRRVSLADAGVCDPTAAWASMEPDSFSWKQAPGTTPPDDYQKITLWRDGVIVFSGVVLDRVPVHDGFLMPAYSITCVNALWFLSATKVSGLSSDNNGGTVERMTFQFPPGDLGAMIKRLLDRAQEIGLPIQSGAIDPMFEVGRKNFSDETFLSTLSSLLSPVPDAVTWMDYSTNPPSLNVTRRMGSMEPVTIRVGSDNVGPVQLSPQLTLRPAGIRVTTAERDANGKVTLTEQLAGDSAGARIVASSGPELLPFTAPENMPSVAIQTAAINGGWAEAKVLDSSIASAIEANGDLAMSGMTGTEFVYVNQSLTGGTKVVKFIPGSIRSETTGAASDGTWLRLIQGESVDFLKSDYGMEEASFKVHAYYAILVPGGTGENLSDTLAALVDGGRVTSISGWLNLTGAPSAQKYTWYFLSSDYTVKGVRFPPAPIVRPSYPALTTLYEKSAYEYLTPVPNLAENLFKAANFTPYAGQVMINPTHPWRRWIGTRLNVIDAEPDWTTAGAIVSAQSVDIITGMVELSCGAKLPEWITASQSYSKPSDKDIVSTL